MKSVKKVIQDPTTLIIVDEADRLQMNSLEQMRSIFDEGKAGLVWDTPSIPQTFHIEYESANWEIVVRIKSTEYGDFCDTVEKDFTEHLPE